MAANLPGQLRDTIGNANLFLSITRSQTPHAFVISGAVRRADDEDTAAESDAETQVEATVTRDGVVLSAIQVNAIQMNYSPLSILPTLPMSLAQGSRASFVSDKFAEVFARAASGARQRIDTGTLSARFMRIPDNGPEPDASVPSRQAEATPDR